MYEGLGINNMVNKVFEVKFVNKYLHRATMQQYLHMDKQVVGKLSLCKDKNIVNHLSKIPQLKILILESPKDRLTKFFH